MPLRPHPLIRDLFISIMIMNFPVFGIGLMLNSNNDTALGGRILLFSFGAIAIIVSTLYMYKCSFMRKWPKAQKTTGAVLASILINGLVFLLGTLLLMLIIIILAGGIE